MGYFRPELTVYACDVCKNTGYGLTIPLLGSSWWSPPPGWLRRHNGPGVADTLVCSRECTLKVNPLDPDDNELARARRAAEDARAEADVARTEYARVMAERDLSVRTCSTLRETVAELRAVVAAFERKGVHHG